MEINNIVKSFCYDWYKKDGNFIIPCLFLKRQNPNVKEEEVIDKIDDLTKNIIKSLDKDELLKQYFKTIFFDGKGFFIPVFACYINAKEENQKPNDITFLINENKQVPYYNFNKDPHFEGFLNTIIENKNDIENFIKSIQKKLGDAIKENIIYLNTNYKGQELLLEKSFKNIKKQSE